MKNAIMVLLFLIAGAGSFAQSTTASANLHPVGIFDDHRYIGTPPV